MTKPVRQTVFIILVALLALSLAGLFLTSGWVHPSTPPASARRRPQRVTVDQSLLVTAQNLGALASTPPEHYLANEALRLADNEVDLAFATALRNAAEHPAQPTPEARQIQARIKDALVRVNAGQQQVDRLTKQFAETKEPAKQAVEEQLQLAKSQLTLDQDELDDARRDLTRAGGDWAGVLGRQMEQHERSQEHVLANAPAASRSLAAQSSSGQESSISLIARWKAWRALRSEHQQLSRAQQEANAHETALGQAHESLEQKQKEHQGAASSPLPSASTASVSPPAQPAQNTAAAIASVRQLSQEQKDISEMDKRIDTLQELAGVYGRWNTRVQARQRQALHGTIQSIFWILLITFLALLADHYINHFYFGFTPERNRLLTLRSILHFSNRALALALIVFVILGVPTQLATILGLVGAGLTVALKDFIVGFFGWFVLMGRNGMRRGDWVEINGVQGRVIEVGLLHTVILETGNWTDAGHPTGRKVTFVNGFAIEGHYFNFTTAGQWLWDDLQVDLRSDTDPYPVVEAIQKIVTAETEHNVKLAEQEWQKVTSASGLHPMSAAPTISLRPTASGAHIVVRYITRADEQEATRSRVYRAICDLLIGKTSAPPQVAPAEIKLGASATAG